MRFNSLVSDLQGIGIHRIPLCDGGALVLHAQLALARARTDELFRLIAPGALYDRPIPERHRIVFYLGHLEAFDWNQVARGVFDLASIHAAFDQLFSFGIDPKPGELPVDKPSDWPSLEEIQEYNCRVRCELDRVWDDTPEQIRHVCIEHRLMHAETLAYILHNLDYEKKVKVAVRTETGQPPQHCSIEISGGVATLGQTHGFGWDNEFPPHTTLVEAFAIDKYKVTNAQYLEFVRAGAEPPFFWRKRDEAWFYRGMFAEIPLPLAWPVYVTQREAESYAHWLGKSLPGEAQFHRAAYGAPDDLERDYPWGNEAPQPEHGNFDFRRWDPVDVDSFPAGDSAFGVSQMVGNAWEWTSTPFSPFPGFQPFPFYPGYSANFFDGDHYVLKGGSARTAACFLRRSFRSWFRQTYPYVYAGFRCVEN